MWGARKFWSQGAHLLLGVAALLPPPALKERHLGVCELARGVCLQARYHSVQDQIDPCQLDL